MDNKTYSVQGLEFTFSGNELALLNKAAPMIAKLRRLEASYMKDIDLSPVKKYQDRVNELNEAKSQLQEILSSGKNDKQEDLTEDEKSNLSGRIEVLSGKVTDEETAFLNDKEARALVDLETEMKGFALLELITDIDFIKPVLKKLLKGDFEKIDFTKEDILSFVRDVITDFFVGMQNLKLK